MSAAPLRTVGKEEEKDGAAWTAGKALRPMLASGAKPKMPRTWE